MRSLRLLLILAVFCSFATGARAQNGIPSDGRDYYMAFFQPSLKCTNTGPFQSAFVLVSAFYDNTRVEVNYFDAKSGREINAGTYNISAKSYKQIPIDRSLVTLDNPQGGVPEYRAIHIHASKPVNCSYYSTGPGWGSMYLGLPTGALGHHYVATTLNANPGYGHNNSWYGCNLDSSSSILCVIAIVDNTHVTISPNATSLDGHTGKTTGTGARGIERPFQVTLQRGQVYFLKSENNDESVDMSGSTIDADQPVGVLAGQENAYNGETQYVANGGDQRDCSVEMMVPVEYWTSDGYMAAPMMDSPGASDTDPSIGDMFRVFTYEPTGTKVDFWDACSGKHTYSVSRMQSPPTTVHNVQCGINVGSETGQKIFVEQYDYRMQTQTEPFPAPSSLNVVPAGRWRNSYMWSVPDDKNQVHKRRYINVIAKSSALLGKIKIWTNGIGPKPITSLPSVGKSYNIPNTGNLYVARRFEITPGAFYATSDSAFGLAQYGDLGLDPDNDLGDNDGDDFYFSYAAPVGQSFSIDGAQRPKITVDTFCSSWRVHIRDVYFLDGGVAQVEVLNDPDGVLKRRTSDSGYVSVNAGFDPPNFTVIPGDTVVDCTVKVLDPLKDAEVWFWALNAAGSDTLIHLQYRAPSLVFGALSSDSKVDSASFMNVPLSQDSCTQFVLKNTGQAGSKTFTVVGADFIQGGQGVFRVSGTIPSLPVDLKPGDSVIVQMCFQTNTPAHVFIDTLRIKTDCPEALAPVIGSSTFPKIYATDWDFGNVPVGQKKVHSVNVKNTGTADLVLTPQWLLHDVTRLQFTFEDSAKLPLTLKPGKSIDLNFSFHPVKPGKDSTWTDWGTNLVAPYEHADKDYSWLWGNATQPGLVWDRPEEMFRTICDSVVVHRVNLLNPTDLTTGQTVVVDSVVIHGPTASEWKILANQLGTNYEPLVNFDMKPQDTIWVDLAFSPDISNLATRYVDREDTLYAFDESKIIPIMILRGHVDAADLTISTTNVDLGIVSPNQTTGTKTITITNPGTAPLIISDISIDNPAFHIVTGPGVGDTIMPGESKTIEVNATVTQDGDTKGILTVHGMTNCPPVVMANLLAATRYVAYQGGGHDYTPTYICRNNTYDVTAMSTGSDTVILKSVEIVDDPSMPGASNEFHFADGTRKLNVDQIMVRDQPYPYSVVFEPSLVQVSKAIVRYTYDTARNQGIAPWTHDTVLTGPGALEHQTVSAAKNDVQPADHYMATSGDNFEVPIRFTQPLPAMADAHQLQFDFTFRRDLFHFNQTLDANGYKVINVSNEKVNGNLETRTITVQPTGSATFGSADELLRVSMELMVARDTNSDFVISNALYTDSKGNDICYIIHNEIPGAFTPIDLCGNDIIRRFEQTGLLTYGIREVGPNPATNSVNVTLDVKKDKMPISIELYDGLGHSVYSTTKVMSTGLHTTNIDVTTLASGEYTLRVMSSNGLVQSKKLVVQK